MTLHCTWTYRHIKAYISYIGYISYTQYAYISHTIHTQTHSTWVRGGARGWPGVAVATTDLSLATPLATLLKTAVFVPFFLTRNAFIKTRNRCIFFASTSNGRLFRRAFQLCLSARRESNERGKGTPAKWASVEQWDAVRLYVSKTNFPVLTAVTVHTAHALIASS